MKTPRIRERDKARGMRMDAFKPSFFKRAAPIKIPGKTKPSGGRK
jgi:hypothetical protein